MRMIDQIRTGRSLGISGAGYVPSAEWESLHKRLCAALDDIPVVIADNIDEFFYNSHPWLLKRDRMSEEEISRLRQPELIMADEYPNAAPPFPRMWIEWVPSAPHWKRIASRFGALISSELIEDEFRMEICGFCQVPGKSVILSSRGLWVTADRQGVCLSAQETKLQLNADLKEGHEQEGIAFLFAHVPLLTMCFMNCGNVHVDWLPAAPQRDKAFQRKHGILPTRRVGHIIVTPMTRLMGPVLADGSQSIESRKRQAANLCRGHFKRYTEDSKLFGRVVGRFFWKPQVRNFDSKREVERGEYRINTKGVTLRRSE